MASSAGYGHRGVRCSDTGRQSSPTRSRRWYPPAYAKGDRRGVRRRWLVALSLPLGVLFVPVFTAGRIEAPSLINRDHSLHVDCPTGTHREIREVWGSIRIEVNEEIPRGPREHPPGLTELDNNPTICAGGDGWAALELACVVIRDKGGWRGGGPRPPEGGDCGTQE